MLAVVIDGGAQRGDGAVHGLQRTLRPAGRVALELLHELGDGGFAVFRVLVRGQHGVQHGGGGGLGAAQGVEVVAQAVEEVAEFGFALLLGGLWGC